MMTRAFALLAVALTAFMLLAQFIVTIVDLAAGQPVSTLWLVFWLIGAVCCTVVWWRIWGRADG